MSELLFDAESHTYRLAGRVIPSVTQLLKPLTDEAFAGIPAGILKQKADLGTAVHYATELFDAGQLDEESIHPMVAGYLDGWRRFRREHDHHMQILAAEHKRFHKLLRYAGTIDRRVMFDGRPSVLDIKTTGEIYPHVGVQLAGYAMLEESNQADGVKINAHDYRRLAVQLSPDGNYEIHEFNERMDHSCFMSLLTMHNWKEKNK